MMLVITVDAAGGDGDNDSCHASFFLLVAVPAYQRYMRIVFLWHTSYVPKL